MVDDDILLLADVFEIAKYLAWQSEIGDKKAQDIIAEIHARKYGCGSGVWVQASGALARIIAAKQSVQPTLLEAGQIYNTSCSCASCKSKSAMLPQTVGQTYETQ
jgi:hypothetical protein